MKDQIHKALLSRRSKVSEWFSEQKKDLVFPVYTSVDVRDAGFKVAPVDANIFPAGFNNICNIDRERAPEVLKNYLDSRYGGDFLSLALITEEHTNNPFYWDNVAALVEMIRESGREVRVTIPRELPRVVEMKGASGKIVTLTPADTKNGEFVFSDGFHPQLILSNNDFSDPREEWGAKIVTPMNPPRELGWHRRKKSDHFKFFNQIAEEFAGILNIPPFAFTIRTDVFSNFDPASEQSARDLSERVDEFAELIRKDYRENSIERAPKVFLKSNSGTYGMSVTSVSTGKEILEWNKKAKKRMTQAKGGRTVQELVLQEGVPTTVVSEGEVAEPTIYMVGCDLVGGFLRTHSEKGPDENLNSPGAVFRRLCISDLEVSVEGAELENVYGTVARLSSLAVGREIQSMDVHFPGIKSTSC